MEMPQQTNLFNWLLFVIVSLLSVLFGFARKKVEKLDERQQGILAKQGYFVTRDELQRNMDQMREDRQLMHKENLDRLEVIGGDINRVHDRIDKAFAK
jgi:hypothetical protein